MTSKKNISTPHIYPLSEDMSRPWFVSFIIYGEHKHKIKVAVPSLPTVEARKNAATEIINDILKNGYVPRPKKKKKGYSNEIALLFELLESKKLNISRKTFFQYKNHIGNLNSFCTEKQITVLKNSDAIRFLESLFSRLKPTTVNAHRNTLKGFYAILKKRKQVYQNPFLDTPKYKENRIGAKWFQPNQQAILKNAIQKDYPELWIPIQYLYYCFIRPIELRRLTVEDINLGEGTINIPSDKSKNKKNQFVVIPSPLLCQLYALKLQNFPLNHYLVGKEGVPSVEQLPYNYLTNRHKKMTDELKFPKKYSLYSWKHTGVAMAYKSGVGIRELQLQLRHHSLDMVTVYMRSLGIADLPDIKDKFPEL